MDLRNYNRMLAMIADVEDMTDLEADRATGSSSS